MHRQCRGRAGRRAVHPANSVWPAPWHVPGLSLGAGEGQGAGGNCGGSRPKPAGLLDQLSAQAARGHR